MKGVRLARPAQADLDEIWSGAADEVGMDYASKLIDEITELFYTLARMPESGRLRPEIESDIRSFPVGDYVVYYRKAKRGGVQIWRVIHGKRNQLRVLKGRRRGRLQ